MEWIKDEESGGEHAVIKIGGRAVWSAVIVTNGESWVPCIVQDAPGGADVLWPPDPGAAMHCPSIEAAKKAAGEVLAQWGRNLIGMGESPEVVWAGNEAGDIFTARIMDAHLMVRRFGRAWAASMGEHVLCYCDSASVAKAAAERAAHVLLLLGGQ